MNYSECFIMLIICPIKRELPLHLTPVDFASVPSLELILLECGSLASFSFWMRQNPSHPGRGRQFSTSEKNLECSHLKYPWKLRLILRNITFRLYVWEHSRGWAETVHPLGSTPSLVHWMLEVLGGPTGLWKSLTLCLTPASLKTGAPHGVISQDTESLLFGTK